VFSSARESLGLRFEKKNITDVIKKIEGQVNYSYNDHIQKSLPNVSLMCGVSLALPLDSASAWSYHHDSFQLMGLRFEKKNITDVIKKIEGQVNYSYNDHIMDNFSLRTPPLVEMN
jgi:hypothetical protein